VVIAREATREDVASWLEIVREVGPAFGPMPDFESVLLRNIGRDTALSVRDPSGQVLGGVLLQAPPGTRITWLAVRASARGRGVGRALSAATALPAPRSGLGGPARAGAPTRRSIAPD
jgi:ribosomal protein S18 acetylase RimI-like enzyme